MITISTRLTAARRGGLLLTAVAAALLGACGGSGDSGLPSAGPLTSGVLTVQFDTPSLPDEVGQQVVQPSFHIAPVVLSAPDDVDSASHDTSARMLPRRQIVPAELADVTAGGPVAPMATGSTVTTYSPAQIRAAYGLPALPAAGVAPTAAQAAQLGAGQTIYIVDAMHDPNAAAELAAFNQKFGLPPCTTKTIAATASLPLPAASSSGCEFSQVYTNTAGAMTGTAPAYNSGWATEIALDVQWAHATAPLARIVLIEAPDASINSLLGAIRLANSMGPGSVSMSFGGNEGSWTASVDSAFAGTNMTYLAATGDSGAAVSWPAVSPKVVAVGGTTLTYTGSGARTEVGWSGTGGGTSLYTPTPSYQTTAVPGLGSVAHRTVADVAFNADPASGQYVALIPPGSTSASWISAGGTSLSTPQWAGLIAAANASRALTGKAALGAPHSVLYGQIATVPGTYASVFADITKGSDGTCATCYSKVGYDQLSGLGTPNVTSLLSVLSGAAVAAPPPVVTAASVSGKAGVALSFATVVSAQNPVTYSLSGAPTGMTIGSTGTVSWASPVAGTYPVTVIAKDSKTGLTGQGVYTVTIAAAQPPVVSSATINGKVGTALSFVASVSAPNPVTYSLSGAPSGMAISSTGTVSWASPVAGTYPVTVIAKDSKTGLSGQGVYTVVIAAQSAPVVGTATINGKAGTALSFAASVSAPNPVTYSLSGAPTGMTIGSTGTVSWASPVVGTYPVTVIARDSKTGLTGRGVYTVVIASASTTAGPVISAPAITGVAGRPLTGSITISDPGVTWLSVSISGVPMGMTFSASGLTISPYWASPVAGSYSLAITVTDSAGRTARTTLPITVAAR